MNTSKLYVLILILFITLPSACANELYPDRHIKDKDDLLWELQLNHKAINLATAAPYDTVTLSVAAYNMYGNQIANIQDISIESLTENVVVYPNGTLKAIRQTAAAGVLVVARASHNGVTLEDTARVIVTSVEDPPQLVSINPALNDTRGYVTVIHLYDQQPTEILPGIVGSGGGSIPRAILHYSNTEQGDSRYGLIFNDHWKGRFQTIKKGSYTIAIDGYVYGKKVSDSITIRVLDPRITMLRIVEGIGIPRESVISIGGGVYWFNHSDDSLDIIFEDPSSASNVCCTLLAGLLNSPSDSGNIEPFIRDMSLPLKDDPCTFICFDRIGSDIIKARSFHTPGRYKYWSNRNPNVWGTIVVND